MEGGCKYSASCGQIAGPKGHGFGSILSDYFWIFESLHEATLHCANPGDGTLKFVLCLGDEVRGSHRFKSFHDTFYDLFSFIFARLDDQATSYPDSSAFWGFGCDSDRQGRRPSMVHGVLPFSPSNSLGNSGDLFGL